MSKMLDKDWLLWKEITFRTQQYARNYDFINTNENILTDYDGTISLLRIETKQQPLNIGEFTYSVLNMELASTLSIDPCILLDSMHHDSLIYQEYSKTFVDQINIFAYKKVVFVHNLVISDKYRKRGISQEFSEYLYRNLYDDKTLILMVVKPFQYNEIEDNFYTSHRNVVNENGETFKGIEYYGMEKFKTNTYSDSEMNHYKLYNIASKCGFKRINDSLFMFFPEIIKDRMILKYKEIKKLNTSS